MGYTHYWSYDDSLDAAALGNALEDARKVVQAVQERGIMLCGGDGTGDPVVTEEICLNGAASRDEDYEEFLFPLPSDLAAKAKGLYGSLWAFCKTARRPYDLAVCALLLVLKHHLGSSIRIRSDGRRRENEWLPAERLVREVLGYEVQFAQESFPPIDRKEETA